MAESSALWSRGAPANVNPDTKANGAILRLVAIQNWDLLLYLRGAADRPIYAVEDDEQGIATSLDDPATMLLDRRVD
jgi:hypothetical protein